MQRCLLVALMLGAACTDWRSLYGQRAQDAGDDSSFLLGETIEINGGMLMR